MLIVCKHTHTYFTMVAFFLLRMLLIECYSINQCDREHKNKSGELEYLYTNEQKGKRQCV